MRAVLCGLVCACGTSLPPGVDVATHNPDPLRDLAARDNLLIGTAIDGKPLASEPLYGQIAGYQFDLVVPENKLKMASIRPDQDTFDFSAADRIRDNLVVPNAMKLRGHTLVYPNGSPAWVLQGDWSAPGSLLGVMTDHVTRVMQHYRGQIIDWDVVNEPFDWDPTTDAEAHLDTKVFTKFIGPDYIEKMMMVARAADPDAKLFVNENGIELPTVIVNGVEVPNDKLAKLIAMVVDFKQRDIPIDGIGMEFHVPLDLVDDVDAKLADIATAMQMITDTGVEIHVTELDLRLALPSDAAALAKQAQMYAGIVRACRANPKCTALLVWGFADRYSWIPAQYPGYGEADLLDDVYAFKPAYTAVQDALR